MPINADEMRNSGNSGISNIFLYYKNVSILFSRNYHLHSIGHVSTVFLKWLVAGVNMEISFRSAHFSYFLDVLCTNRIEVSYYAVRIMFL